MPALTIQCSYGSAEIQLQGAQVTSWRPHGAAEMLFVSEAARHQPGEPIRGGVPIAFPQFAELGPLPKHGFAQLAPWRCTAQSDTGIAMTLRDFNESRALWAHAFELTLAVKLGPETLQLELSVHNPGPEEWDWSGTLHTYLALDTPRAVLRGLGPAAYIDRGNMSRRADDPSAVLHIGGHTDRAYLDAGKRVEIDDGARQLTVTREGFRDTVVWNPGPETSGRFIDLLPDDHRSFLCVEAAEVRRVTIGPADAGPEARRLPCADRPLDR